MDHFDLHYHIVKKRAQKLIGKQEKMNLCEKKMNCFDIVEL